MITVLSTINWLILWYFIILNLGYINLLWLSLKEMFFSFNMNVLTDQYVLPSNLELPNLTVFIPAFNEENTIVDCVLSVLKSKGYPNLSIIVVNDGSTDGTLSRLIEKFELYPVSNISSKYIPVQGKVKQNYRSKNSIRLTVIDKENGQKSDALNAALNYCRTPLFICLDADTVLEPMAISNVVLDMLIKENTVAVGGAIYVLNNCEYKNGKIKNARIPFNPIPLVQAYEYLRSFLFSRSGWNQLGGSMCYSGAFTLLNHRAVLDVGGFDYLNPAQDFEIITHLIKRGYEKKTKQRVSYTPAAIAWTIVPKTLEGFWRQRVKWQVGSLRSLMRHKSMFLNPKYGVVGIFTYPFFLLGETLSVFVELMAYCSALCCWYFGILDPMLTLLIFILCWGFVVFLTIATALMGVMTFNRYEPWSTIGYVPIAAAIETFGFRQYHVICRAYASLKYFFRSRF